MLRRYRCFYYFNCILDKCMGLKFFFNFVKSKVKLEMFLCIKNELFYSKILINYIRK